MAVVGWKAVIAADRANLYSAGMKFREGMIPKTKRDLLDAISDAMLRAPRQQFPDWEDFDGAFYCMLQGVSNIRHRIGGAKAEQLLEMLGTAKAHYEANENKLGGGLMEDTKMLLMDRQAWAYPKELYRWTDSSSLPELSEADIVNRKSESD